MPFAMAADAYGDMYGGTPLNGFVELSEHDTLLMSTGIS